MHREGNKLRVVEPYDLEDVLSSRGSTNIPLEFWRIARADAPASTPGVEKAVTDLLEGLDIRYPQRSDDDAETPETFQQRPDLFIIFVTSIQRFATPRPK